MKRLTKTQIIGLFVIAVLACSYVLLRFLKAEDIFGSSKVYYATIDNVQGIAATVPVDIKGLKIGNIEKITYNNKTESFVIKLRVKSGYSIPKDSWFEMYTANILGNKGLRIVIGDEEKFCTEGDTLPCIIVPDMISEVGKKLEPLSQKLNEALSETAKLVANINEVMDQEGKENLKESLAKMNKSLANVEHITSGLKGKTPQIEEMVDNITRFSRTLSNNSERIDTTLANVQEVSRRLSEAEVDKTIAELNSLLAKIQDPNGSIGKLMKTDQLHNSVDSLVNNINDLIAKIKENPRKFIKISVF